MRAFFPESVPLDAIPEYVPARDARDGGDCPKLPGAVGRLLRKRHTFAGNDI
jgi:hypothetical protein